MINNLSLISSTLISFSLFSLLACGGGSSSTPQTQAPSNNPPVVSAGDFETLRATITLAGIPDMLISQDASTPQRVNLSVSFDVNNDGIISAGDLRLNTGVVSDAQTGEERFQTSLTEYVGDLYSGFIRLAYIEYEINANEVTFVVQKSVSEKLNLISTQTQVTVSAAIWPVSTSDVSSDYLPAYATYSQVQNVSTITDAVGDYSGTNAIIDISQFKLDLIQ